MEPEATLAWPRRPTSEVEWEDLLLRVEVMPRALRVLLEGYDAAYEHDDPALADVLEAILHREETVRDFLEQAASHPNRPQSVAGNSLFPGPSSLQSQSMDRFVRLRARNFAMVQRRGIDVWEWEAPLAGKRATVHQVLSQLVMEDVAAIAAIREVLRDGSATC